MISGSSDGILVTCGCAAIAYCAGFPIQRILIQIGLFDRPNARSSHGAPTVRGGGIAILASIIFGALVTRLLDRHDAPFTVALVFGALAIALVSFLDDFRSLPPALRLCSHLAVAFSILYAAGWPRFSLMFSDQSTVMPPLRLGVAIMILWLVGYTNAFNFMDGINGIAAGQALVTAAGAGIVVGLSNGQWTSPPVLLAFAVAGASAGFLPHNFPQARMFMGDVGSAPLGFLLAALTIWISATHGWWLFVPLALLHANFILDTSITMLRRLVRGEKWYAAHREHFYQRLVRSGKSHSFVTLSEMGLQTVVLSLMLVYPFVGPAERIGLIVTVVALWSVFFCYCEAEFHKANRSRVGEFSSLAVKAKY